MKERFSKLPPAAKLATMGGGLLALFVALTVIGARAGPQGAPQASPTSASVSLTGFGATQADWQAGHEAVPGFPALYNPDPSLPPVDGHTDYRYVSVNFSNGRALGYLMNLPPGTAQGEAVKQVLGEFPSDARVVWRIRRGKCFELEVASRTVTRVLAGTAPGDSAGWADIQLDSGLDAQDNLRPYDPQGVEGAAIAAVQHRTAASTSGC